MNKLKRLLAIIMIAMLVFSMIACGKKDNDDDDDDKGKTEQTSGKDDAADAKELYNAIEKGLSYNKGTYELKFDLSAETDESASISGSIKGTRDGEDSTSSLSFGATYNGEEISLSADNLFTVADGMAYVNFDTFLKALLEVDAELGSFGVPTPNFSSVDNEALKGHLLGMLEAFLVSDIKVDGDTYTVSLETAEEYYNGIKGLVSYLDENGDDINAAFTSSSDVEAVKEYLKELVDYLGDDLATIFIMLGNEVDSDTIAESLKTAIDEFELEETEVDLFKNFDTVVDAAEKLTVEDFEEMLEGSDIVTEMKVTLTDTDFSCKFTFEIEVNDESVAISIDYNFKGDDSVSIAAPDNASTLTEMLQYLIDNPEVLEEITGDVGGFTGNIGDDPTVDNEAKTGSETFTFDDGSVLTVTYDKNVFGAPKFEDEYQDVQFIALDGSESEIDVSVWAGMDAEYAYSYMLELYVGSDDLLASDEAIVNGLDGYYFQINNDWSDALGNECLEYHFFVNVPGADTCVEYDLYYFTDCVYSQDELIAGVPSVTVQ